MSYSKAVVIYKRMDPLNQHFLVLSSPTIFCPLAGLPALQNQTPSNKNDADTSSALTELQPEQRLQLLLHDQQQSCRPATAAAEADGNKGWYLAFHAIGPIKVQQIHVKRPCITASTGSMATACKEAGTYANWQCCHPRTIHVHTMPLSWQLAADLLHVSC